MNSVADSKKVKLPITIDPRFNDMHPQQEEPTILKFFGFNDLMKSIFDEFKVFTVIDVTLLLLANYFSVFSVLESFPLNAKLINSQINPNSKETFSCLLMQMFGFTNQNRTISSMRYVYSNFMYEPRESYVLTFSEYTVRIDHSFRGINTNTNISAAYRNMKICVRVLHFLF